MQYYTAKNVQDAIDKVEQLKALGFTEVDLLSGAAFEAYPWKHTVTVSQGSRIRLGVPVELVFKSDHPCGISFRWSLNVEKPDADGKETPQFDIPLIERVCNAIPDAARLQLSETFLKWRKVLVDESARHSKDLKQLRELTTEVDRIATPQGTTK